MNYAPLDPNDTAVLFADLQAGIIERSATNDQAQLRRAVAALANREPPGLTASRLLKAGMPREEIMPRRLVICADGTWNTPDQLDRGQRCPSNVVRTVRAVRPVGLDGVAQLIYYHGVKGSGGVSG